MIPKNEATTASVVFEERTIQNKYNSIHRRRKIYS